MILNYPTIEVTLILSYLTIGVTLILSVTQCKPICWTCRAPSSDPAGYKNHFISKLFTFVDVIRIGMPHSQTTRPPPSHFSAIATYLFFKSKIVTDVAAVMIV